MYLNPQLPLGGLNDRGVAALTAQPRRRFSIQPDGSVVGPDGKPVDIMALSDEEKRQAIGWDSLGSPGARAPAAPAQAPASSNYLDKDRERWQGKGYKSVDDALAASLAGEGPGSGGGFAIQGPGGQWFSSNEERDKALAASPNLMDQFQAFKLLAPKLGIFPGASGGYDPKAFGQVMGMANEGKKAQSLLEEGLTRQYQLATRGPQEDAVKLGVAGIEAQSRENTERMRGDTARDIAERNIRGQLSSDKMKLLTPLITAGDKAGVEATTNLLGSIERASDAARRGKSSEEVNNQLKEDAQKQAAATSTQNLMKKLGVSSTGKDKAGIDQFSQFNADTAIAEVMRDPALLKNQDFVAQLRKGGGRNTPESIRAAVEQALLPMVNEPSLTASSMEPLERTIDGLTFSRAGGDSMLPARQTISAGGQTLSEIVPRMMPLGEAGAGMRNVIPRFWKSGAQKQQEQQAAIALYKALHGIP